MITAIVGLALTVMLFIGGVAAGHGLGMGLDYGIFLGAGLVLLAGLLYFVFSGRVGDMVEWARLFYIRRVLRDAGLPYTSNVLPRYIRNDLWRPWRRLRRSLGPVAGAATWIVLKPSGNALFAQACDVVEIAMEGSELLNLPDEELVPLMLVLAPAVSDLGVPDGKALCVLVDEAVERHSSHAFSGLLKSGDVIANIRALNAGVAPEYVLAM